MPKGQRSLQALCIGPRNSPVKACSTAPHHTMVVFFLVALASLPRAAPSFVAGHPTSNPTCLNHTHLVLEISDFHFEGPRMAALCSAYLNSMPHIFIFTDTRSAFVPGTPASTICQAHLRVAATDPQWKYRLNTSLASAQYRRQLVVDGYTSSTSGRGVRHVIFTEEDTYWSVQLLCPFLEKSQAKFPRNEFILSGSGNLHTGSWGAATILSGRLFDVVFRGSAAAECASNAVRACGLLNEDPMACNITLKLCSYLCRNRRYVYPGALYNNDHMMS